MEKIASGIVQRSAFTIAPASIRSRGRAGRGHSEQFPALGRKAIAPIGDGDEAAQRHQECAAPDPVDERLEVNAQGPGAAHLVVYQRLFQRFLWFSQSSN